MARPRKDAPVTNLPAGGNVTMHNTLVSASHGLNLGEKRLVAMAVAKLSPKAAALPGKPIKISALDFAEQYGVDADSAYEQLRDAQENLFQRYITHIEHFGPTGQRVMVSKMRWVSSIHYEKGAGEILLAFAPEIAQFLVQLKKHFTSYQLSKAAALRSTYSWRLFENLERFRETVRRLHAGVVIALAALYVADIVQRKQHFLGELAALFQDRINQVGCRVFKAGQVGVVLKLEHFMKNELHVADRGVVTGHVSFLVNKNGNWRSV